MLRGTSLDGKGQTVDELTQLGSRDIGVAIEGCKDSMGREWRDIGDRVELGDSADRLTE